MPAQAPMPSAAPPNATPRPTVIGVTRIICGVIGIIRRGRLHVRNRRRCRHCGNDRRICSLRCRHRVGHWRRGRRRGHSFRCDSRVRAGPRLREHRRDDPIGNALLPQVNNLLGIQAIAARRIGDIGHHRGIADFCLFQLEDLLRAVRQWSRAHRGGLLRRCLPRYPGEGRRRQHQQRSFHRYHFRFHNFKSVWQGLNRCSHRPIRCGRRHLAGNFAQKWHVF